LLSSCVRLSVCHKPVLYQNDWTNRASLWHRGFLPPVPHRVVRKYGYLQKLGFFPLRLCPKLRTSKISPRQLDRVVNKTRRRRRRSSLLATPIRQSTSRGCLLQVSQLQPSNSITANCRAFVVQLVSTVDKILTEGASRGPSATAELLVVLLLLTTYSCFSVKCIPLCMIFLYHFTTITAYTRLYRLCFLIKQCRALSCCAICHIEYCFVLCVTRSLGSLLRPVSLIKLNCRCQRVICE